MNDNKTDQNALASLFAIGATLETKPVNGEPSDKLAAASYRMPRLSESALASDKEMGNYWRILRTFFRSGAGGGISWNGNKPSVYSALLAPFIGKPGLRDAFPVWVAATSGDKPSFSIKSLNQILVEGAASFKEDSIEFHTWKEHLPKLEEIIRGLVDFAGEPFQAAQVFDDGLQKIAAEWKSRGRDPESVGRIVESMARQMPKTGLLIPFSPLAPLHLLSLYLQAKRSGLVKKRQTEFQRLSSQMEDVLFVERQKKPKHRSTEALASNLDFAGKFLNINELASALPKSSSLPLPEEKLKRLEWVIESLKQAEDILVKRTAVLVLNPDLSGNDARWKSSLDNAEVRVSAPGQSAAETLKAFEQYMTDAAKVFAAARIGQLELADQYRPELHDDFFKHFDWRSFNPDEMAICPSIILATTTESLTDQELTDFSHILSADLPVKLMIFKSGVASGSKDLTGFLPEVGALAVAHRNAYVFQTSNVNPERLMTGFAAGFEFNGPAVFHLYLPKAVQTADDMALLAGSASEGREFPSFSYDSRRGPQWGMRFDLSENPGAGKDWPEHQLRYQTSAGTATAQDTIFTFADFAIQEARFARFFHVVPPAFWTDDLIPIAEYLQQTPDALTGKVPFVWVTDAEGKLQKAAVAWPLVQQTENKLDFWRYLQENAGIHSFHVEQAKMEMQHVHVEALEALKREYEAEIERIKSTESRATIERLASALLGLDAGTLISTVTTPAAPKPPVFESTTITTAAPVQEAPAAEPEAAAPAAEVPAAPAAAPSPAPLVEVEEPLGLGEAWIETPLCTSCNECINNNNRIFGYNADKQAMIINPKGGPFSDIVLAAEKCPVKIIHPGAPQDPSEAGLEEWIQRAEPFQ